MCVVTPDLTRLDPTCLPSPSLGVPLSIASKDVHPPQRRDFMEEEETRGYKPTFIAILSAQGSLEGV